jgi:hypothetical protein
MKQQRMTISALARAEGVDKALVSRRVKRLKLETLPGPRGAKEVNVAAYLRAMGRGANVQLETPPSDELDAMARKGRLGRGTEGAIRIQAARAYRQLVMRATSGDLKALTGLHKINQALGEDGAALCRSVIVDGRPLLLRKIPDTWYDNWQVLAGFQDNLDIIGERLGFPIKSWITIWCERRAQLDQQSHR